MYEKGTAIAQFCKLVLFTQKSLNPMFHKAPPLYRSNWYFKGHFIFGPALSKGMIFVAHEKNNKGRQQPMPTYSRSLTAFVQRNTSSEWHYFGRKRRPDMFCILVSKAYNIINSLELLKVRLGNWDVLVLNIPTESTIKTSVLIIQRLIFIPNNHK